MYPNRWRRSPNPVRLIPSWLIQTKVSKLTETLSRAQQTKKQIWRNSQKFLPRKELRLARGWTRGIRATLQLLFLRKNSPWTLSNRMEGDSKRPDKTFQCNGNKRKTSTWWTHLFKASTNLKFRSEEAAKRARSWQGLWGGRRNQAAALEEI